jgi:chaperonin GroEL (HSP60 family)
VEEAERSIHDALCVVRDIVEEPKIVAGGGAPELEISRSLRKYAETLPGREQLAVRSYADAFEVIPITLIENAGLDPIDILSELRVHHEKGEKWAGIEVVSGKVQEMSEAGVFEPLAVKKQIIKSATEAASMILKIDDVIAAGKMRAPPTPPGGMPPGGAGYPGMGEY